MALKQIHVINTSSLLEKVLTLLRPLMREEVKKMVSKEYYGERGYFVIYEKHPYHFLWRRLISFDCFLSTLRGKINASCIFLLHSSNMKSANLSHARRQRNFSYSYNFTFELIFR